MTSFDFDIPEKELVGSEMILRLGRKLAGAFTRKARTEGLTKMELATRMDVDKSAISRMMSGNSNLTFRTFGELCWALGVKPEIILHDLSGNGHESKNSLPSSFYVTSTAEPTVTKRTGEKSGAAGSGGVTAVQSAWTEAA